jgi:hypothetical protein
MGMKSWFEGTWKKTQEKLQGARTVTWTRLEDVAGKRVRGWWSSVRVAVRKYVAGPTLDEIHSLSRRVEELAKKVEKVTAVKISAPKVARARR